MNEATNIAGTGTRGIGLLLTGDGLVSVFIEAKYAIGFLLILIIADFRYGWGESNKRYLEAKATGDKRRMDLYKWRTSRAIRKSFNKLADFVIIIALGWFAGMALLEPIGISHKFGLFGASVILALCELSSIFGHFFYLHGVKVEKKTISGFLKALVVAIAKRKDSDVGEAIEETFNHQKE